MNEFLKLFKNLMDELPSTIEINGKKYDVKLIPVKEEELIDTTELINDFNTVTDDIDPEIWEIATTLFAEKYNAKLFDELVSSKKLSKDKFEQLKNGIVAFNSCVVDAANARINYLTDKYINGLRAKKPVNESAC